MKRYKYTAREKGSNKVVKGFVQAENERAAGKLIIEQGLVPDTIKEEGGGLFAKKKLKIPSKARITFTRQFATLIGAGLPLSNSLRTVAEQTEDAGMKAVIEDILVTVESGKSLYEAMCKHDDVFSGIYLALIQAGEMSGSLDNSLARLAAQEEKDEAMISKIKSAFVYPAILLIVILAVLVFMMVEVVPEVVDLYDSMDEELPGITKFLQACEEFIIYKWWLALIIVGALVFFGNRFLKTDKGTKILDTIKLKIPVVSKLFLRLYVSRFARTAEMLLGAGVAMLDSVGIACTSTSNKIVEEEYSKSLTMLKSGKPLSDSLRDREYMLPLVYQMASIGEESGKIDEMLGKAAEVYENELDETINNISTLIEPILMVVMAGLIGVVLAGTLLPIYSLVTSIT